MKEVYSMSVTLHAAAAAATKAGLSSGSAGLIGGGASLAAIIGFAWLVHHLRTLIKHNQHPKNPIVVAIAAFLLGALLTVGGGGISQAFANGAGHVASMLG
jgi:hypothetical protein